MQPIFSRYKSKLATQGTDTTEQYLTKLKTLAKDIFNDPDEMIRDRIVFGVSEEKARETLINVGSDLTHPQSNSNRGRHTHRHGNAKR